MKIFLQTFVLTCAVSAFAQSPTVEIRVTGEHRMAGGETLQSSKEFALADATRKAWQEAVLRLQDASEVKAVRLKPNQLDSFVAAILETQEQPPAVPVGGAVSRVDVLARLDIAG